MPRLQQQLESAFPSFIIDIRAEQATMQTKITVFNANRYSNTLQPQTEEYFLTDEELQNPEELIKTIKTDFNLL